MIFLPEMFVPSRAIGSVLPPKGSLLSARGDFDFLKVNLPLVRLSAPVKVPADSSLDRVMMMWHSQVRLEEAVLYVFKSESEDPVTSMDGIKRVFAHYVQTIGQVQTQGSDPPTVILQPASDGKVSVRLSYHHLGLDRKYVIAHAGIRVRPDESENDLSEHWFREVHNDVNFRRFQDKWHQHLKTQSQDPTDYELYTGDLNSLQRPWWD
jgi:hypothetical protein